MPAIREAVAPAYTPTQAAEATALAIAPWTANSVTGRRFAPSQLVRPLAETPERPRIEVTATLGQGDLAQTLRRAGVSGDESATVAKLVGGAIDPAKLRRGTAFDVVLGRRESRDVSRPLDALTFRAAFDLRLEVVRDNGALRLNKIPIAVDDTPLRITGKVGPSLYKSARAAGIPASAVAEAIKALSFGLDFQRDITASDKFDIIVEHRRAETGETETGKLLYAGIDKGKRQVRMMRWTLGGKDQFFDANGEATSKGLLRTPVDGARISSNFGLRRHPILGFSRLHKGMDFAAATGTPILAAAAGKVIFASRNGGYGNYVILDHGNGMRTAYAHLSRFGTAAGKKVSQGQVIGYVGTTGMSTGPHLHYELYRNGQAVNPASVKFTSRTQLAGRDLSNFKAKLGSLMAVRSGAANEAPATAGKDQSGPDAVAASAAKSTGNRS